MTQREGYCCYCTNLDLSLVLAAKEPGNPCNECWFTDDKSNWTPKEEGAAEHTGWHVAVNGTGPLTGDY